MRHLFLHGEFGWQSHVFLAMDCLKKVVSPVTPLLLASEQQLMCCSGMDGRFGPLPIIQGAPDPHLVPRLQAHHTLLASYIRSGNMFSGC
jgi:hypothetical protein